MKVNHPILGDGEVIKERFSGSQCYVVFKNGLSLWIRKEVLKFIDVEKRNSLRVAPARYGDHYSRKMIEAFKLGIVPYFGVSDFTFGREKQINKIRELINRYTSVGGGVIVIEGEYGSGKTHLLDYLYYELLREGYAISRVELDFFDVAPYKPKHVYREIINSFEVIKDMREYTFKDILIKACDIKLPQYHIFLSKAMDILRRQKYEEEIIWAWISGDYLKREYLDYCRLWRLPVLLDHAPACDIYAYILSGIGYILKKLDIKGFIIMLDEAEILWHLFYRERSLSFYFYRGWIETANNKPDLTKVELLDDKNIDSRLAEYLGIGRLDKCGMLHSAIRPTPYIYQIPSGIILILSLTPSVSEYYKKLLDLIPKDAILHLDKLSQEDIKAMYDRLISIYEKAYNFEIPQHVREQIFNHLNGANTRHFLRWCVEVLDVYRHYS